MHWLCSSCSAVQCAPVQCSGFGCPLLPFCPNLLDVDRFDSAPATLTEITTCNLLTDCPVSRPLGHLDERYVRLASPGPPLPGPCLVLSVPPCPCRSYPRSVGRLSHLGPVSRRSLFPRDQQPPRPLPFASLSPRVSRLRLLSFYASVIISLPSPTLAQKSPSRPILSGDLPGLTGSPSRSPAQRLLGSPVPLAPIPSLASVSRAAVIFASSYLVSYSPSATLYPRDSLSLPCLLPDPSSHVLLLAPSTRQPTWLIPQN